MMAVNDDQRPQYSLPSMMKSAFHACNEIQRKAYYERRVPIVDIQSCCQSLFQILKFNSEADCFDPEGDRTGVYAKVKSRLDDVSGSLICERAARHGHEECMELARALGVPWYDQEISQDGRSATSAAAHFGHLDCLRYAYENGSPVIADSMCSDAALGGNVECLRYAREVMGCPWDLDTCLMAAFRGNLECLEYAKAAGCDWDESWCARAANGVY